MLLKLGLLGLRDSQKCILFDCALHATAHARHGSRILRYEHWPHSTLLVVTVPLRALAVVNVVHDLAECNTIVEVNLYRLALLMVIDECFAMLVDI